MEYLFLSNYDGGYNWTIKSSLGDYSADTYDNTKVPPVIKDIVDEVVLGRNYVPIGNSAKDILEVFGVYFDLIMLCEDGDINIIKDEMGVF